MIRQEGNHLRRHQPERLLELQPLRSGPEPEGGDCDGERAAGSLEAEYSLARQCVCAQEGGDRDRAAAGRHAAVPAQPELQELHLLDSDSPGPAEQQPHATESAEDLGSAEQRLSGKTRRGKDSLQEGSPASGQERGYLLVPVG